MERLTPDAKFALAQKLSGKDLVKLCATDTSMRQICATSRYDPIWVKLLKDDYNIDYIGDNAYMEYLQNTYFLTKTYYVLIFSEPDHPDEILNIIICKTREEAYEKTFNIISKNVLKGRVDSDWSYLKVKASLAAVGRIDDYKLAKITLEEGNFDLEPTINYEQKYRQKLKQLSIMVHPDDKDEQRGFIHDFEIVLDDETLYLNEGEDYSLESLFTTVNSKLLDNNVIFGDLENYDEIEKFIEQLITNPSFLD